MSTRVQDDGEANRGGFTSPGSGFTSLCSGFTSLCSGFTSLCSGFTSLCSGPTGLALALAVFAWHVWHFDFLIDDAFISFRYAANWASGDGLSFNPGEAPVEGYSNFLWVALLALASLLGAPLEGASRLLSIAAATTLVVLLFRSLRRRQFSPAAVLLGTLALVCFPPFATWATGGLETSLFALFFFLAFDGLFAAPDTDPRHRRTLPLLLAGAGLTLVRTDGFAFVAALGLTTLLSGSPEDRRRLRPLLAAAVVTFGAYVAWRRAHYGLWVANTVRAKADPSLELLLRGLRTSASYLLVFGSPLLAIAALLPGRRGLPGHRGQAGPLAGQRPYPRAAALAFFAFLAYDTLIGGDWMPMFRMLAPASPLLAIVVAGLVQGLGPRRGAACAVAAIAVALLPSFDRCIAPRAWREALAFRGFRTGYESERERWQRGVENLETFAVIGKGLAQVAQPGESFTAGAIGAIGYYSGLWIFDRNGLVDPTVAARDSAPEERSAGHDKRVPRAFFLDRSPTYFEALVVTHPIPGPESPGFAKAARSLGRFVLGEPGEAALRERCLPEAHALRGARGVPAGSTLLLLRATPDAERARARWSSLGL